MKSGWDSSCSFHLGHEVYDELPIPGIAGFKEREKLIREAGTRWNNIYPSEHFQPISQIFTPDLRAENMVSFKKVWPEVNLKSLFNVILLD